MLTRRHLIALSAASALAPNLFTRAACAQTPKGDFPNKPVRLIVPVAAGGPTDIVARMLGEKLSKMWGQQVVVENKGGAGTNIGNEYVARANPDGYTILFGTASLAVNPSLYRALKYDPLADLVPVSLVTQLAYYMFVPNSSPARSVREFIDYAKSRPGKLTMGSPGTGSAPYLAEMLFLKMAGIEMTHVPYRGASPAFTDLIPGRLDCYFGSGTLLSYARSGQARVLAATGPDRDAAARTCPRSPKPACPATTSPHGRRCSFRPGRRRRSCGRSAPTPSPPSPIRRSRTSSPSPATSPGAPRPGSSTRWSRRKSPNGAP